jgi:hypothetical protein
MIGELKIGKDVVMAQFKALSWNLPGRTEKNHEKRQDSRSLG